MDEAQQKANKAKILESMRVAEQVRQGGNLTEGELIDFESLEGNMYKGYIVFKKPTMGEMMQMGAKKSELLKKAGVTVIALVDDSIQFMAHVMATLEVACVKRPDWFLKLEEITEPEILYHVYARYQKWENSFRRDLPAPTTDDNKDAVGAEAVDTPAIRVQGDSTD
jgi:hypothetical protein